MTSSKTLQEVIDEVEEICKECEDSFQWDLSYLTDDLARESALNLIHTVALRKKSHTELHKKLMLFGLSLHNHERNTLTALKQIAATLHAAREDQCVGTPLVHRAVHKLQEERSKAMFGHNPRYTSIMVTLDPPKATVKYFVELLKAGMDVARINTAHDSLKDWIRCEKNLREAEALLGIQKRTKIHVDLAGPKCRTAMFGSSARVKRVRAAHKDIRGVVTTPLRVVLGTSELPVEESKKTLKAIKVCTSFQYCDARGKQRRFYVVAQKDDLPVIEIFSTTYFESGSSLFGSDGSTLTVGQLPVVYEGVSLKIGDQITFCEDPSEACAARLVIPVQLPLEFVERGHSVVLDDAKCRCVVLSSSPGRIVCEVQRVPPGGWRLRPFKGVNLPDSACNLSAITPTDRKNLAGVASFADIVGLSFVRSEMDVKMFHRELEQLDMNCATVLKIETLAAMKNLPSVLIAALGWVGRGGCGLMFARGDLAAEIGFHMLPAATETLTTLATAAHLPLIFATQVLESLTKRGFPSRAEVIDAVQAHRCECVMLNKGPFIADTTAFLVQMLANLSKFQHKHRLVAPLPLLDKKMLKKQRKKMQKAEKKASKAAKKAMK